MSLSTCPELNPTPLEPWTAVYSNAGCSLRSKGKQWKVYPFVLFFLWKLLWLYQTEKVNGGDVNKFDLHVQQQDRMLPPWDWSSSVARRAFLVLWAFQDGWWLLKGMWSKSEMVRVRSSPPPHNKTGEKRPTMEWSKWRTFASHWPPASQTGPPGQAWSVALSNPMQHLCIQELWMEAFCPTIENHNLAPMAFCCLDTTKHRAACSWYPKETGPELWGINQFTTSWMMSVSIPVMINVISTSTIGN